MEIFTYGFPVALGFQNLLYCFLGVFAGTFVGVLPGIGAISAISLLFPLSYYLDPTTAIIFLAGIYYGAEYGGSTASILLNLPGTASSAVTCLEGYPLARQGRAASALFITSVASFVGGTVGILLLMFIAPSLADMALALGPFENFSILVMALVASGTIGRGSAFRGGVMVLLGLMLAIIGIDTNVGITRLTFGVDELFDGINIVILAMGLFGVAEVISAIMAGEGRLIQTSVRLRDMLPTAREIRRCIWPTIRGTGLGSFFGVLPGTGPTIAAFSGYAVEKRLSAHPERFGTGLVEGLASPESANNAAAQTAFVPTLTLGIPGSATMAIVLGALIIHGVAPGPLLIVSQPELFWGLIASFWIGNVLLLVINVPMIGLWVRLLSIPYNILYPTIIALICVGAYSINSSIFDVWMVMICGVFGYFLRLFDFDPAPLLVGFILGPMLERNLRNAMSITGGDLTQIVHYPVALVCGGISVLILGFATASGLRMRRRLQSPT